MTNRCPFCTSTRRTQVGLFEHIQSLHPGELAKAISKRQLSTDFVVKMSKRIIKETGIIGTTQEILQ